jgi:hypothetical protein
MTMCFERFSVCIMNHTELHLRTFASNCSNNGRPIIVIGVVSALFVCSFSWRISGVGVKFSFFSPAFWNFSS